MALLENYPSAKDVAEGVREQKWNDHQFVVLMADDDEDDFLLVKMAFEASPIRVDLRWVEDGHEAMDYLLHSGRYVARKTSPRPDLVLLDLMMPRKDGLETLKEIKGHPYLRKIPVVLLTSSRKQEHVSSGFKLGADSFIVKPHNLEEMIRMMGSLRDYYFGIVRMPEKVPGPPFSAGTKRVTSSGVVLRSIQ